ncbi:YbhB/YbcL family Raf kinase inhibitor-like protein [Fructobacillus sp. M158]|uniref:YbhB/YbcL family Raf kinase inhibitor-like protein n=1 Tax=Fructobacillus parabroussonetiae TaxID=2713174 RepID=UPI00200ADBEB|nr:YbhB/YbcL family Raf kinase inhibitor-like protein [Fructobacillus parabroussonetiae]MCK8617116.1 YbhB/YbcL family Raf kinase inhibitor-like protein [Fructobacillus parabroussonetiae]
MKLKQFDGYLPDQFGKYAADQDKEEGVPVCSLPISISDLPAGTKDLVVTFIDYDAVPVCGFPFIHWLATNFGPVTSIPADASRQNQSICQGSNSFASKFYPDYSERIVYRYGGPMPPDKEHDYTLTVYALDEKLNLTEGYYLNDLLKAMKGHVLAQTAVPVLAKA